MSAINSVKCVVTGDRGVGKTCFLITFTTNKFPDEIIPTLFDNDNNPHNVQLHDGRIAAVSFSDTGDHTEGYDRLRQLAYLQADVFLVCFSVDSPDSLENIRNQWIPKVTHYCPDTPWILVGMKSDLRTSGVRSGRHMVEKDEAVQLSKDLKAVGYYECSSLEPTGLDDIVQAAVSTGLDHSTKSIKRKFTRHKNAPEQNSNDKSCVVI